MLSALCRPSLRWGRPACKPGSGASHPALSSHRQRRTYVQCSVDAGSRKQRVLFLGTPDVAAIVLKKLLAAATQPNAAFEVVGVVSQPGKPKGRGNKAVPVPSPVEALAVEAGPSAAGEVLTPASAKDPGFLARVRELAPDLAVTAAYGNMLPQSFLDIPRLGTLNIHPSLLPQFRGAAPVQRAVQAGVAESGVSVAYTVLRCDAGPVLAQERVAVDPEIQAPELLAQLFERGADALLRELPDVWAGRGGARAQPQDEAATTHAAKLAKEEGCLDCRAQPAQVLHNAVRAFAGWPGTTVRLVLLAADAGASGAQSGEVIELRVIRTKAPTATDVDTYRKLTISAPAAAGAGADAVAWAGDGSGDLLLPCQGGSSVLRVTTVQPPTKKAMPARDFQNGLRGKRAVLAPMPAPAAAVAGTGAGTAAPQPAGAGASK